MVKSVTNFASFILYADLTNLSKSLLFIKKRQAGARPTP